MPQSQSDTWSDDDLGTPQLEGPDYVALVIEWDDDLDEMAADASDEEPVELRPRISHPNRLRNSVLAAGAAGVLALMTWRLRRRRHA